MKHGMFFYKLGLALAATGAIMTLIQMVIGSVRFTTNGIEGDTLIFMVTFLMIGIGFILMAIFYKGRDCKK